MAVGDVKSDLQTVASGSMLSIQPPPGEEWVIHNLYWSASVNLRLNKGGTTITFDSDTGQGARLGMGFHVTNTQFLQIMNNNGASAVLMAYDGIQTK